MNRGGTNRGGTNIYALKLLFPHLMDGPRRSTDVRPDFNGSHTKTMAVVPPIPPTGATNRNMSKSKG